MPEIRDSLAQVLGLLGRATFGALRADGHKNWFQPTVMLHSGDEIVARYHHGAPDFTCTVGKYEYELRNAEAVEACVNFVMHHGPALMAMMEGHSPDAGKMGEDGARLDWFSGGIDRFLSQCPTGEWCAQDDTVGAWYGDTPRAAIDAARAGERG